MGNDVIGLDGAKLDLLCKRLRNLSDLLDSNDDESNANVCKQAADAIWNLYACVGDDIPMEYLEAGGSL